jgi:hypothetical protein
MEYRGFVLDFFDYVPRVYAYNEDLNMSFEIGLTDIQKEIYSKMYGEDDWKTILTNSMKRLIDNWLAWKE